MNFSKVVGRNLKILAVWLVLAVWLASTKRVDRAKVWGTNKAYLSPFLYSNSASISNRHEIDILSACKLIPFYVVDV